MPKQESLHIIFIYVFECFFIEKESVKVYFERKSSDSFLFHSSFDFDCESSLLIFMYKVVCRRTQRNGVLLLRLLFVDRLMIFRYKTIYVASGTKPSIEHKIHWIDNDYFMKTKH